MRLSSSGMLKTFDSSTSRSNRPPYQELLETLGVIKSQSNRVLPTTIRELKTEKKLLPDLTMPVARKDAQALIKWLDNMLGQIPSNSSDIESILESALSIYEMCFHEVVRQVSIQCKERGELINRIWKAYISLLERALRISQASQQTQIQQFKQEKENLKNATAAELNRLKEDLQEKNAKISAFNKKLQIKEEEMSKLEQNKQRLSHRLDLIISHYETVMAEMVALKEEKRVLKLKLLNTETEFIVNANGVIEAQHKRQKIKRKSEDNLKKIVNKDPIISHGVAIDYTVKENLNEDIVRFEDELNELFVQADFVDVGIDAPITETQSKEIQTEVEFLSGDSIGEPKETVDTTSMVIELIDLNLQSMLSTHERNTKELKRQATTKQTDLEKFLKDSKNNEKIKVFIEKMNANIGVFTNQLHNSVYNIPSGMNSNFKPQKTMDPQGETKRLKTIRKKMWSYIQESRLKKQTDIASLIVHKIKNTPQHKLKKIIVKKILLKFIFTFYETRLQRRVNDQDPVKKQEFPQQVLEVLNNKHGPGKAADNKFTQIISSCIKYRHIRRVKLFGRFLQLYEEFDLNDLDLYFELLTCIKNSLGRDFPNSEYSDQFFISYEKALDIFKSNLLQKLPDADKKEVRSWLEGNKIVDMVNKIPIIDVDSYLELIIEKSRRKKYARVNFLRCIYEAADLNEDGYLQQVEFDLLARHMSSYPLAEGFTIEIFNEFAEQFTDENENVVQALSFENFSTLSSACEIFTEESMQSFSKITNSQGAIWHVKQVTPYIDVILEEIKWRLSKKHNWKDLQDEYGMVLEVVKNKIIEQKHPESVWIALRLLQEESKLICIEKMMDGLLPNVKHLVITGKNVL